MTKAPDDKLIVTPDEALPTRRDMLCRIGGGFGALALSSMLSSAAGATTNAASAAAAGGVRKSYTLDSRPPMFPAKGRRRTRSRSAARRSTGS
jgi:hypothetical protein